MNRINLITALLFWLNIGLAQKEITIDSHWLQSQLINPASMKTPVNRNLIDFTLLSRKQWLNFPGAPCTILFDGYLYLTDLHTKLGIQIMSDKIGHTSQQNINAIYGYNLTLSPDRYFRFGVSAGFYIYQTDMSLIETDDAEDPAIRDMENKNLIPNYQLGLEYDARTFQAGGNISHIQEYFNKDRPFPSYIFYTKYKYEGSALHNWLWGVGGYSIGNQFQAEANSTILFKNSDDQELWWLGATWRNTKETGLSIGLKINQSLSVNYSYRYNYGRIRKNSYGTHELWLNYNTDLQRFFCPTCQKLR